MVWIYEVLEVHDRRGMALGKFRLVRWKDVDPERIEGLCNHTHGTPDEAMACTTAGQIIDNEFRERIAPDRHAPLS